MILRPTSACPEFLESFSDFVDGTLPPDRRAEFQAHLDCCQPCLRHLSAYRRGVEALSDLPEELAAVDFWARLQHKLWHEDIPGRRPTERAAWRTPSFAALATAAVAIAVVWTGLRIEDAVDRAAGGGGEPIVVMADPAAGSGSSGPARQVEAAGRGADAPVGELASAGDTPPRVLRAGMSPVRSSRTSSAGRAASEPARAVALDAAIERDFQRLRARIETEAWLGSTPIVTTASLQPRSAVGIRMADVRPSEPLPVAGASFTRP